MRRGLIVIRVLGVLVGAFLALNAGLSAFGAVQYSGATPPLGHRLLGSIPLGLGGCALMVPYRRVRSGRWRVMNGTALILLTLYVLYISADGAVGYLVGDRNWQIVPVATFFLVVTLGNLWAFLRMERQPSEASSRQQTTD